MQLLDCFGFFRIFSRQNGSAAFNLFYTDIKFDDLNF